MHRPIWDATRCRRIRRQKATKRTNGCKCLPSDWVQALPCAATASQHLITVYSPKLNRILERASNDPFLWRPRSSVDRWVRVVTQRSSPMIWVRQPDRSTPTA